VDPRAGAENLTPTGILSPGRPVRRQSLHRLHIQNYNCVRLRDSESGQSFHPSVRPSVRI